MSRKITFKDDPLESKALDWIKDTTNDSIPVSQHTSKLVKKATYYLSPDNIKGLKLLGVEQDRDLSDLVNEAIEDLIRKYQ